MSLSVLVVATDIDISSSKSSTSADISKYSGISISRLSPSNLRFKVSFKPGIVIPSAIILSPTLLTLPLVTSTLLNLSVGRRVPVIIVNGT